MRTVFFACLSLALAQPLVAQEQLSQSGGELLGGQVVYDLNGTPGRTFVLLPSTGTGPVPLPGGHVLSVGLDLLSSGTVGVLVGGAAQVTYPLPADANLVGLVIYAQYVTLGGATPPVDDVSNRTSFVATLAGQAVNTVSAVATPRQGHTLSSLGDGRVLIAGGDQPDSAGNLTALDTIEFFDPQTQTFSGGTVTLSHPRAAHTATVLSDGRVLLVGGYDLSRNVVASAEIYDPVANTITAVPSLSTPRTQHTATLLADGRVLVLGGSSKFDLSDVLGSLAQAKKSAEVYDPNTNAWSNVPNLPISQNGLLGQSAGLLGNGQVLVAGGVSVTIIIGIPLPAFEDRAWRFDATTNNWVTTASMGVERVYHGQITLNDGRALVVGGADGDFVASSFFTLGDARVYDPAGNNWSAVSGLNQPRAYPNLVDTGSAIAVVGGLSDVDVTTGSGTPEQTIETTPYGLTGFVNGGDTLLPREIARTVSIEGGLRALIVGVGDNGQSAVDTSAETYAF